MRKCFLIIVVLFSIVCLGGCFNKDEDRTINYILDRYVRAYTKADINAARDIFPPYYNEYVKDNMTRQSLKNNLKSMKLKYGDDFNLTYQISDQIKLSDEELNSLNENISSTYSTDSKASECYKIEGTITFKGSKKNDTAKISAMNYCMYDKWYLVTYKKN